MALYRAEITQTKKLLMVIESTQDELEREVYNAEIQKIVNKLRLKFQKSHWLARFISS